MRLSRLELTRIGPFEEASFDIPEPSPSTGSGARGELVLFEGPNGSGKTSIVEAIAVLLLGHNDLSGVSLDEAVSHMNDLPWLATMPPVGHLLRRRRDPSYAVTARITHEADSMTVMLGEPGTVGHLHAPRRSGPAKASRLTDRYVRPVNPAHATIRWSDDSYENSVLATLNRFGAWPDHDEPVAWAAFAYRAHHASPELATPGPLDIEKAPLAGALSFGAHHAESSFLGQLLANLENERTKAMAYARDPALVEQRRLELESVAQSRQTAIRRFERVFSDVLGRRTTIEFSIDRQAPVVAFDGEQVPIDLLGEGLRSTMAWLSDLLVRLERIRWADTTRSPIDQDFWLILDEIDESLHPTMQVRILPALRALFPNARIYATTHSPFVVASVGQGTIFAIRPDADHRVRGEVRPLALEPDQSLEWVVTEVFDAQAGFVDRGTLEKLQAHKRDVRALERAGTIEWGAFSARRAELMALNDEVRAVVAMQEVPVRIEVDRRLRALAQQGGQDSE